MKKYMVIVGLCTGLALNAEIDRSLYLSDIVADEISIDARIGFIDSFSVMGESSQGLKIRTEIEAKRDMAAREIQESSKRLEKSKGDYVNKSTTMTETARKEEVKTLEKMERDLKNLVVEKEEELKLDMQLATEKLAGDLDEGVIELAQKEGLDIILDKSTGRAVYVSDKYDFTEKAIAKVNEKYELKLAQAQKVESTKLADNKRVSDAPNMKVADNKRPAAAQSKISA